MRRIITSFIFLIIMQVIATPCYASDNKISWTKDELAFMKEHPVIRLGVDPEFVPFEFIDIDGEYKGIAAEIEVGSNTSPSHKQENLGNRNQALSGICLYAAENYHG
jgi:hypothetical protein